MTLHQQCPRENGHWKFARPVDATQTILDIEAGDKILYGVDIHTIREVQIYRSTPIVEVWVIGCGREWIEGKRVSRN